MHFNQKQVIEPAIYFKHSPLRDTFEKQTVTIGEQGRKQIDAIANQNKGLVALTNKNSYKDNYKEIFEELVKEKLDEIKGSMK